MPPEQAGRVRWLAGAAAAALALAALAVAAQAQILTPTPPPELWDTPAGEQLDAHAPEDPGEKYDVDAEAGFENSANPLDDPFVEDTIGVTSARVTPVEQNVSIPTARPTDAWKLQAGARYGRTDVIADSVTPFDAELHTIRFQGPKDGIAAGTVCAETPEPYDESRESKAEFRLRVQLCRDIGESEPGLRVPVIYRYLESPDKGAHWREDYRGSLKLDGAKGGPGFVGALEWIEPGRALAVGGTGVYPRRELRWSEQDQYGRFNDCRASASTPPPPVEDCTPANPLKADVAGAGRAWLFEGGEWEEIDLSVQRETTTSPGTPAVEETVNAGGDTGLWVPDVTDPQFAGKISDPIQCPNPLIGPKNPQGDPTCPKRRLDGVKETVTVEPPREGVPRAGIRGMTALAIWPSTLDGELGFAGANGQLWRWKSERDRPETGRFDKVYDASSPDLKDPTELEATFDRIPLGTEVRHAAGLRFRVRELRPRTNQPTNRSFLGITAGCCMPETAGRSAENFPKLLGFSETTRSSTGGTGGVWYVRSAHWGVGEDPGVAFTGRSQLHALTPDRAKRVNPRQDAPDSFYAFSYSPGVEKVSIVHSPGGPAPARGREPASLIGSPFPLDNEGGPGQPATLPYTQYPRTLNASLSSARLVAADGDTDGYYPSGQAFVGGGGFRSYARPDWAAGVLRARGQGLLVSTHEGQRPTTGSAVERGCSQHLGDKGQKGDYPAYAACLAHAVATGQPPRFNQERAEASLRSRYFLTDSYALGAIDIDDQSGAGWAVGDHGAILSYGASAAAKLNAAGEPEPPALRPRGAAKLADRSPYRSLRPAGPPAGGAGDGVPALAERPLERLARAELRPAGAPDPERVHVQETSSEPGEAVTDVVMSRDGSEGWAIGPLLHRPFTAPETPDRFATWQATLYHFDGRRWSRCDPFGIPGRLEPDSACESLKPLFLYRPPDSSSISPVNLVAAARVPYENDSDPSNDDEFEVVAIGTDFRSSESEPVRCTILRYRDGRWRHEGAVARAAIGGEGSGDDCKGSSVLDRGELLDVAFAAPNDGWILGSHALYRFTGTNWINCSNDAEVADCGNGQGRLVLKGDANNRVTNFLAGLTQAGERVYLYGQRRVATAGGNEGARYYPMIMSREGGAEWRAEHDPGFGRQATENDPSLQGQVEGLAVARSKDGSYSGWASGGFGAAGERSGGSCFGCTASTWARDLMRLDGDAWRIWTERDASVALRTRSDAAPRLAVLADAPPGTPAALASYQGIKETHGGGIRGFTLGFDPERGRWTQLPLAGSPIVAASALDQRGGYWLAGWGTLGSIALAHFSRLSATHPREVFSEVPNPVQPHERLTALAGSAAGTLWAGTNIAGTLYRYERDSGWERIGVPGWSPGKIVLPEAVNAIAVNDRGSGIAVGKEGRIADIDGGAVKLDPASGTSCDLAKIGTSELAVPCGTGRTLRAAAIASDGSALAGGDFLALLWRPPGGDFRAVERPEAASSSRITGISMPSPERAFLTTGRGLVFAGSLSGGHWSWRSESLNEQGQLLSADVFNQPQALNSIAVRPDGSGYAVGARGLVLERTGDGGSPWRRVKTGFRDDLYSVAVDAGGGPGVLIGAARGQVLTLRGGRFQIARAATRFGPEPDGPAPFGDGEPEPGEGATRRGGGTPPVRALALVPGVSAGQAEAWALTAGFGGQNGSSRLFHFASDPTEPLLDPVRPGPALADSPSPRTGELSLAALGRTRVGDEREITNRVVEELAARARRPGGPRATLFTGDLSESPTLTGPAFAGSALTGSVRGLPTGGGNGSGAAWTYNTFQERIAEPLDEAGVPLFGALGKLDIAEVRDPITNRSTNTGETYAWRQGMAARPWPRGRSETLFPRERAETALSFRALPDSQLAVRHSDQRVEGAKTPVAATDSQSLPAGGASTHYAVEVVDESGAEPRKLARIVVLDNSHRSLAASDPVQQPFEPKGGQALWLEEMLCTRGERAPAPGARCTRARPAGDRARDDADLLVRPGRATGHSPRRDAVRVHPDSLPRKPRRLGPLRDQHPLLGDGGGRARAVPGRRLPRYTASGGRAPLRPRHPGGADGPLAGRDEDSRCAALARPARRPGRRGARAARRRRAALRRRLERRRHPARPERPGKGRRLARLHDRAPRPLRGPRAHDRRAAADLRLGAHPGAGVRVAPRAEDDPARGRARALARRGLCDRAIHPLRRHHGPLDHPPLRPRRG